MQWPEECVNPYQGTPTANSGPRPPLSRDLQEKADIWTNGARAMMEALEKTKVWSPVAQRFMIPIPDDPA
jgi:hypothetical protein